MRMPGFRRHINGPTLEISRRILPRKISVNGGRGLMAGMAWCGEALCEKCGGVPGDLPDTGFGHLGQANMTTPPTAFRARPESFPAGA